MTTYLENISTAAKETDQKICFDVHQAPVIYAKKYRLRNPTSFPGP